MYEKTINIPMINNNGQDDYTNEVAYNHGISDVDYIWVYNGCFNTPSNSHPPLYTIVGVESDRSISKWSESITSVNKQVVYITTYQDRSTWSATITFRYIKTTD